MGRARIGTSGWVYKHWRGDFYPEGLPARCWLDFYAGRFDTAEINGSFYRLPTEAAVAGWAEAAPEGFVFAWKASRYITHAKKLKDVADSLRLVFGRMAPLGDHLGPALFQLPPQLKRDDERLACFLGQLPKDRRCAVEFRDPGWYVPAVLDLLRDHGAAFCISDHAAAPSPWETTADFLYVRGHGPGGRYVGRYDEAKLADWARRIRSFKGDAYAYFDNDIGGAAPIDAARLQSLVNTGRGGSAKS